MVRSVMRRKAVLKATGWSNSTLYNRINDKKFPKGTKLDPDVNLVVWWEDEIEAWQKAASQRAAA